MSDKEIQALAARITEQVVTRVTAEIQAMLTSGVLPGTGPKGSSWQENETSNECILSTTKNEGAGESLQYQRRANDIMKMLRAKEKQSA